MPFYDIPFGLENVSPDDGAHSKLPYLPVYIDDWTRPNLFFLVDEEDFMWTCRWRWQWNPSKNGKKLYVRRTGTYGGRYISIYLHKAICLRARGLPPSPRHIIADHRNGNELDCRRANLDWATPADNRQNYHGLWAQKVVMDLKTKGNRLLRAYKFDG